jgi:hypothetical protein
VLFARFKEIILFRNMAQVGIRKFPRLRIVPLAKLLRKLSRKCRRGGCSYAWSIVTVCRIWPLGADSVSGAVSVISGGVLLLSTSSCFLVLKISIEVVPTTSVGTRSEGLKLLR